MEATFKRMDLAYEAMFSAPSFNLPQSATALLESLYEKINPLAISQGFSIAVSDMHVFGGNSLSDIRVRIAILNGDCSIDVTADKLSIGFSGLQNGKDLDICKDCISLSEQAVRAALSDLQVRCVVVRPTLFLELDREAESASSHLAQVADFSTKFNLGGFGNAARHPGVNLEVENTEEGWNAIFNAFRVRTERSSLIISCYALYNEDGAIQGLENRTGHLERLIEMFLTGVGLETSTFPGIQQ